MITMFKPVKENAVHSLFLSLVFFMALVMPTSLSASNNDETNTILKGSPVVMINNKVYSNETLDQISDKAIENMMVLKGENAVGLYGEIAQDGAIIIDLKNGLTFEDALKMKQDDSSNGSATKLMSEVKSVDPSKIRTVGQTSFVDNNFKVIINDNTYPYSILTQISPNALKSVTVFKEQTYTNSQGEVINGNILIIDLKDSITLEDAIKMSQEEKSKGVLQEVEIIGVGSAPI